MLDVDDFPEPLGFLNLPGVHRPDVEFAFDLGDDLGGGCRLSYRLFVLREERLR